MDNMIPFVIGVISSLAAEYIPPVARWFGGLSPVRRILLVFAVSFGFAFGVAIYRGGWTMDAFWAGVYSFLTSQATHLGSINRKKRKAIMRLEAAAWHNGGEL